MANLDLLVLVSGVQKRRPSSAETIDFTAVRVGVSQLPITEAGGHFAFGGKKLTSIVAGAATGEAVEYDQMGAAIAAEATARDAAIAVETAARTAADSAETSARTAADAALQASINAMISGNTWRAGCIAATSSAALASAANGTALSTLLPFTDDEGTQMVIGDFADGQYLLSKNGASSKIFKIYDDAGTLKVTTAGVAALALHDAMVVQNDLPASPHENETVAVYAFTGADVIRIGSFAWNLATGINLNTFVPAAGIVATGDTIQAALQKIVGNLSAEIADRTAADSAEVTARDAAIAAAIASEVTARDAAIAVETAARIAADSAEVTARNAAIAAEATARDAAIAVETSARIAADSLKSDKSEAFKSLQNVEGAGIVKNKVVFVSGEGQVQLAQANDALSPSTMFGLVEDAVINDAATGLIRVRAGDVVPGFSGLVVGSPIYINRNSAGGYAQNLVGFVAGEHVVSLGKVLSSTEIVWNPEYKFEY